MKMDPGADREAQHLIPYSLCQKDKVIEKAIKAGFHPNLFTNGLEIFKNRANGKIFHSNHPAYDEYVKEEIEKYIKLNDKAKNTEIKNFIENTLIPDLMEKINKAWSDPKERSLNTFFKEQGWK